jgi:Uroporphyrinogen-III decarboxylase
MEKLKSERTRIFLCPERNDCILSPESSGLNPVILSLQAPFSAVASLVEPFDLYRLMKKSQPLMDGILSYATELLTDYAVKGLEGGAKIISIADPLGNLELVGEAGYREFPGKYTAILLKNIKPHLKGSIIHLCGKTSASLEAAEYMTSREVRRTLAPYGKLLMECLNTDISFVGYGCINCEGMSADRLWIMDLNDKAN